MVDGAFYVYALKDPRSSPAKPFYVGKGVDTRAWDHLVEPDGTAKGDGSLRSGRPDTKFLSPSYAMTSLSYRR
jgi:hypothetical protein